jgi:hypothetical protein
MKLIANGRPLQHYEFAIASDSLVAADGTIWSHAATLGTRFKGDTFTIDRPTVENFVNGVHERLSEKGAGRLRTRVDDRRSRSAEAPRAGARSEGR